MKLTTIIFAVLMGLVFSLQAEARGRTKLLDPPRVSFGCHYAPKQMRMAIRTAMSTLSWSPNTTDAGIAAQIIVRGKHTLNVLVKYDDSSFDVDYVSSDNLKYKLKSGVPYIHPNANSWMNNLKNQINTQLMETECSE